MGNILEKIKSPADLKGMDDQEINALCDEIRREIISTVSNNGGHLASNLGVVELTVALALSFDFPKDKLVWDVGHQCYPYKLLTGRYPDFSSIRTEGGISGFPNREESPYDTFTTGHSSTSISSALGLAKANYLQKKDDFVIAVIGDGALSGGLAYEGLNNAGRIHHNLIVILNDNNMSISANVGSMARYLTYIRTKPAYIKMKHSLEEKLAKVPLVGNITAKLLKSVKLSIKKLFYNSTLFEDLGFTYYGLLDGHDINSLRHTLETAKMINKPVLIHIKTNKGKGYHYAEQSPRVFHGLSGFDIATGDTGNPSITFSDVFGDEICKAAEKNDKICAITAAMQHGTGLSEFKNKFKDRFFDVGIAEEHAVTFSGGLAAGGMLPVFAVYSTFLQRAYDEILHDISLQNFKAILAIDRAGIVGDDGVSHQGLLDAAYLQTIPNIKVYSPAFFDELRILLSKIIDDEEGLCAVRYPRGTELFRPAGFESSDSPFSVYGDKNSDISVVTYGRLFSFAAKAADDLKSRGINIKVIKLNRIIPICPSAVLEAKDCGHVFFFEEGVRRGGIGEHFLYLLNADGFTGKFTLRAAEDPFLKHASMFRTLEDLGLTDKGMVSCIENSLS